MGTRASQWMAFLGQKPRRTPQADAVSVVAGERGYGTTYVSETYEVIRQ